jgi:hypothetical protein
MRIMKKWRCFESLEREVFCPLEEVRKASLKKTHWNWNWEGLAFGVGTLLMEKGR